MTIKLSGILEIDQNRGVIYFHLNNPKEINRRMTVTALRICHLPRPIPEIVSGGMMDITHMIGCNWKIKKVSKTNQ